MAQDKKSFVLYSDLIYTISQLPDDKAGQVFKHLLEYVNDNNPETDDLIVNLTFEPIKQQLKRDLEKWTGIREKRSEAGKSSAVAKKLRKEELTKSTSVESVEQNPTNPTVSVNDNVSVSVIVNDNVINKEEEFKNSLTPFLGEYNKDLLNSFFLYWTEKSPKGKKMRFEKEKVFDPARRLVTWSNRQKGFDKEKASTNEPRNYVQESIKQYDELKLPEQPTK